MRPDAFDLLAALNPLPSLSRSLPGDEEMLAAIVAQNPQHVDPTVRSRSSRGCGPTPTTRSMARRSYRGTHG